MKRIVLRYLATFGVACALWIPAHFPLAAQTDRSATTATAASNGNPAAVPPFRATHAAPAGSLDIRIPLKDKSVRFAVIGDSGTGERAQYEVAQQMEAYWQAT